MKFTLPAAYFISLNVLRGLSVVAICLVFAGEIYTINSDIKELHAVQAAKATPSTTASTHIVRRAVEPVFPTSRPSLGAITISSPSRRLEKVHRRLQRRLAADAEHGPHPALDKREPVESSSSLIGDDGEATAASASSSAAARAHATSSASTRSSTAKASRTSSATSVTATSAAAASAAGDQAVGGCTYVGSTSIPKGPGGALFSTLERIFAAFILLLALVSELPLPFPPLSRPAVLLERFWIAFFPPFGNEYGVGVLGAVQVFVGAQVLSHYTKGWVQVSAWLLFLVGILDLLFGLALGSRLKVHRSLSQDSTTPSALRKLRLQREAERAPHDEHHHHGGAGDWHEFDREHPAAVAAPPRPERPQRRSILQTVFRRTPADADAADEPADSAHEPPAPRSTSRNGPNGIVIGAPRAMVSKKGVEVSVVVPPPPTYQYGRE
ncbi:hypothetical protein JCM9279_005469 [Rhodotorula babjevae]